MLDLRMSRGQRRARHFCPHLVLPLRGTLALPQQRRGMMVTYIEIAMAPQVVHGRSVEAREALLRQALPAQYPGVDLRLMRGGTSYPMDMLGDVAPFQAKAEVGRFIDQLLA